MIFRASSDEPVSMPTSAPHQGCFCSMISAIFEKSFGFEATAAKEQWLQLMPPSHFLQQPHAV
jgi:hypothetical protein